MVNFEETYATDISDHDAVLCSVNLGSIKTSEPGQTIMYRTQIHDINEFNMDLVNQPWENLLISGDPDIQMEQFCSLFSQCFNRHTKIKKKIKRKNTKPFLAQDTRDVMRRRDKQKKEARGLKGQERFIAMKNYKKLRNTALYLQRRDEKSYFEELINNDGVANPWNVVNKVFKTDSRQEKITLKVNETKIDNPKDVANVLNNAFVDKIERLRRGLKVERDRSFLDPLHNSVSSECNKFKLKTVTESQVVKAVKKLKSKKSSGLDDISSKVIKSCIEVIKVPLTRCINSSIVCGKFPEALKVAKVTPIFKNKGSKQDPSNYRPIANLSIFSKILESLVEVQIRKYFESNCLLPKSQFGFRKQRGTSTAAASMINHLEKNKRSRLISIVSSLDLSSAFDTLDKDLIKEKLIIYGFDTCSADWVYSFLSNRKQIVSINGCLSDQITLNWGTPQGSILSPLLFIIFLSDLELCCNVPLCGYADDYSILVSASSLKEAITLTEKAMRSIKKYMDQNGLFMNESKTQIMVINPGRTTEQVKIHLDGNEICETNNISMLGLKITNDLKWDTHISDICDDIKKKIGVLSRLRGKLTVKQLINVGDGLIGSKIRYCAAIYGKPRLSEDAPVNENMQKIQTLLNHAGRLITNVRLEDRVPIRSLHESCPWISLNQTVIRNVIVEAWKALQINGTVGRDITGTYNRVSRAATAKKLNPDQKYCSDIVKNSALLLNNECFEDIKDSQDIFTVKKTVKKHIAKFPI